MDKIHSIHITLAAAVSVLASACTKAPAPIRLQWPVMGTSAAVTFRGYAEDRTEIREIAGGVYDRINDMLSAWDEDSELSRFARSGSKDLSQVSQDVRPCYETAFKLARESGNAFNPCLGKKLQELGFTRVSGIDLGAIAKGFAVDAAAAELARTGYAKRPEGSALLLDLGGNLRSVKGTWRTGVRNPFAAADPTLPGYAAVIELAAGESVATSGNYERFVDHNGLRVSHILDGRTGEPVAGIAGVTVLADSAMMADGLSTTLFVLGPVAGAAFLEKHYPSTAALWIPDAPTDPRIIATPAMCRRLVEPIFPVETNATASANSP